MTNNNNVQVTFTLTINGQPLNISEDEARSLYTGLKLYFERSVAPLFPDWYPNTYKQPYLGTGVDPCKPTITFRVQEALNASK